MDLIGLLNASMSQGLDNIRTCTIGKIEKFDSTNMKADVQPLVKKTYKDGAEEDMALLIEVPVSFIKAGPFFIRPPYKKGDIVLVVFSDKDIENTIYSGESKAPNSDKEYSMDDAIVVGGIMPWTTKLPTEHSDDLLIATEDMSTKFVMKENGDIIVQGGKIFLGNESAIEGVPLGDTLKSWLDSHTHPYSWTDPGGSGNTSPPDTESPLPSEVVRTV